MSDALLSPSRAAAAATRRLSPSDSADDRRGLSARLDTLTGLRFVAALLVFALHLATYAPNNGFGAAFRNVFGHGPVGVSFFFILSGFVLTWSHREGDTARAFYRRRFARIAPAYWVALAVALTEHLATPPPGGRGPLVTQALPSFIGVQAWFPSDAYHYGGNSVGWSVSVELFFYAAFPALILLCHRRGARVFLGIVALGAVIVVPAVLRPSESVGAWAIYIFPLGRLAEFVCGVALAVALRRGIRLRVRFPAAVMVAVVAYAALGLTPSWAGVAAVTIIPFLLLIGSAAEADLAGLARWRTVGACGCLANGHSRSI